MKFNILVAALALVSCGSNKQSNSAPFSCVYALTGCGDAVKQPLIKDIGKTTQKELEDIDREHLAQKKMEKARSQSTTEFFEAYFEYLNGLAPDLETFGQIQWQVQRDEGPNGDSVLNGDVDSSDFWNDYMRSLTGFFRDEKQKFGKLGNHTNKIASELSFAIMKKAEIQGTEATIESVEVNVDDIGSTSHFIPQRRNLAPFERCGVKVSAKGEIPDLF